VEYLELWLDPEIDSATVYNRHLAHEKFFTTEVPRWAEQTLGVGTSRRSRAIAGFLQQRGVRNRNGTKASRHFRRCLRVLARREPLSQNSARRMVCHARSLPSGRKTRAEHCPRAQITWRFTPRLFSSGCVRSLSQRTRLRSVRREISPSSNLVARQANQRARGAASGGSK